MGAQLAEPEDDGAGSWSEAAETVLIAAMRRGSFSAFTEAYRRFAPMLARMARRRDVPPEERDTLVAEHLEDTLMPILDGRREVPEPLGAYLAAGFRRRLVSLWRAREAERQRRQTLTLTSDHANERVVAEGLSAYALREAESDGDRGQGTNDTNPTRTVRCGLADVLTAPMSPEERVLMGQVAEHYPQREIAEALGVAPIAVRVRIHRIRERLVRVAVEYIGTLPADDGIRLARFLETPRARRATGTNRRGPSGSGTEGRSGEDRV